MKNVRWALPIICLVSLLGGSLTAQAHPSPTSWQTLAPGLQYTTLAIDPLYNGGRIHAFKMDLKRYRLDLAFAKDFQQTAASARQFANFTQALIATNGGFFTPQNQPIGLRIRNRELSYPLQNTSWWGVFTIEKGKPKILSKRRYRHKRHVSFALQAGPRLVINGRIPSLKAGLDNRTALGITPHNRLILLVTENAALSTNHLAHILARPTEEGGLNCVNALNLDGGRSSQLYAKVGDFSLNVPNFSNVADAVIVQPKRKKSNPS